MTQTTAQAPHRIPEPAPEGFESRSPQRHSISEAAITRALKTLLGERYRKREREAVEAEHEYRAAEERLQQTFNRAVDRLLADYPNLCLSEAEQVAQDDPLVEQARDRLDDVSIRVFQSRTNLVVETRREHGSEVCDFRFDQDLSTFSDDLMARMAAQRLRECRSASDSGSMRLRGSSREARSGSGRTRGSKRSATGTSSSSSDPGDGSGDSDPPGSQTQTRGEIEKSPRYCRGCGLVLRGYAPQARDHSPAHTKWWHDNNKVAAEPVVGIEYGPGTKTRAEIRAAIAKQQVDENPDLLLDDPEKLERAGVVEVSPETVGADFFDQLAKWKLELTNEEIPSKINFVRRGLYEEAFVRRPRRLGRARQVEYELLLERHSQIRKWYSTRIAALESLRGETPHGFKWSKPATNPGGTDGDVFRLHLRPLETGRLAA